jgi:hypothetical protein
MLPHVSCWVKIRKARDEHMFSALVPIAHVCRNDEPSLIEPVGDGAVAEWCRPYGSPGVFSPFPICAYRALTEIRPSLAGSATGPLPQTSIFIF